MPPACVVSPCTVAVGTWGLVVAAGSGTSRGNRGSGAGLEGSIGVGERKVSKAQTWPVWQNGGT